MNVFQSPYSWPSTFKMQISSVFQWYVINPLDILNLTSLWLMVIICIGGLLLGLTPEMDPSIIFLDTALCFILLLQHAPSFSTMALYALKVNFIISCFLWYSRWDVIKNRTSAHFVENPGNIMVTGVGIIWKWKVLFSIGYMIGYVYLDVSGHVFCFQTMKKHVHKSSNSWKWMWGKFWSWKV
jgi:hypothetical protein